MFGLLFLVSLFFLLSLMSPQHHWEGERRKHDQLIELYISQPYPVARGILLKHSPLIVHHCYLSSVSAFAFTMAEMKDLVTP